MAEVSIIVPVFNMASDGKLEFGIRSLVNQTLQDIEILAVDDASTDDSAVILERLRGEFPDKIKLILSPENRRQGGARNLGLEAATGKYIGFMDADDWVAPDLFEKMHEILEKTGADAVGCDLCRVSEHTMVPTAREACNFMSQTGILNDEKRKSLLRTPGPVVTKLYRREIFEEPRIRFPEHMAYEDNAVATELCMRIRHYEHIPEAKYFYYQRPGSTTHTITLKQCEDRMEAMRIMLRKARENGSLEIFHEEYENRFFLLFYRLRRQPWFVILLSYMQGGLKKSAGFIRKLGKEMRREFPNFRDNPYYLQDTDAEERKYIDLQQKSTLLFILLYDLKKAYRKIRYGK